MKKQEGGEINPTKRAPNLIINSVEDDQQFNIRDSLNKQTINSQD